MTVHAVVCGGAIVGMHRSIKSASVLAWTLALKSAAASSPPPAFTVESWIVSSATGGTIAGVGPQMQRDAGWTLNVAGALASKGADSAAWIAALADTDRVPRILWGTFMRPI